ncbi:MAG TPA: GNAT family N-acetyltransferase [Pseudonocardiaceae bacterium]
MTPFLPLRTARLTLRAFAAADAPVLNAYRNDPEVARYQDWDLPVAPEATAGFVARQAGVDGPRAGEWVQLALDHEGELVGDFAVGLDPLGGLATVGYSLRTEHQGRGYATEALAALVDALFARGVHRVGATLDPENVASAMVLERVGFRYEGRARQAAPVRGEWLDDDRYELLREDREEWLARPTGRPAEVRLVPVTPRNLAEVGRLATHHSQERFVAPMAGSFRDALVPAEVNGVPVVPWLRAVEADGELAGFVMLAERTEAHPFPYLWRLLIDRRHQRRGIGGRVLRRLADDLRAAGSTELRVSWVPGRGGPEPFYLRHGFTPTGTVSDGEIEGSLPLVPPAAGTPEVAQLAARGS